MSEQDGIAMYQVPAPGPVIAHYIAQPFGRPLPIELVPPGGTPPIVVASEGWACPRCARVYGPQVTECRHCNGKIEAASLPPATLNMPDGAEVKQGSPEDRATWWTCENCKFTGPNVGSNAADHHVCMGSCGGTTPNPNVPRLKDDDPVVDKWEVKLDSGEDPDI